MIKSVMVLAVLCGWTVLAESMALRYEVECLGGGVSAELSAPGAAGTGHGVTLKFDPSGWSRFNWPLFRPVRDTDALSLYMRNGGAEAASAYVRVLGVDGAEWQSGLIKLTQDWQQHTLRGKEFKVFRGGAGRTGLLSLGEAIQVQIVPTARRELPEVTVQVDEVRLLPAGPVFTHDGDELRLAAADPRELDLERINDLRGRWAGELRALATARLAAERWSEALAEVLKLARGNDTEAARRRMDAVAEAWLFPGAGVAACEVAELPLLTAPDFQASLALYEADQPTTLADYADAKTISRGTLYSALKQSVPSVFEHGGERCVRQRIVFSAEPTRQVVFLNIAALNPPADLSGRRLFIKLRCTAKRLNASQPFALRLYSSAGQGVESWAQFAPERLPDAEWGEYVFAVDLPAQRANFDAAKVSQLALRIENVPGAADDFLVEAGPVRMGWPAARERLVGDEVASLDRRVLAAREALFAEREKCAGLENTLAEFPALNRRYRSSFEMRAARDGGAVETVFGAGEVQDVPEVEPWRVRSYAAIGDGRVQLEIEHDGGETCAVAAELRDPEGRVSAAGRGVGGRLRLTAREAALWQAGNPCLYTLVVKVTKGTETVAFVKRTVGLRVSETRPSGVSTVLRHAVNRRWPDWSARVNGLGAFGRFAAYPMSGRGDLDAGVRRMFDELWMDGIRYYGFNAMTGACASHDRLGISMLASAAPSYRSLTSWADMAGFLNSYETRCDFMDWAGESAAVTVMQVGNEVELAEWGSDIIRAFPFAPYQPLDVVAGTLKSKGRTSAPMMYVRAGHFNTIPPLPNEDICGVNQYTGRYSGRMEEIERDLAEIALQSVFANRPLMITEWNGPKYSWASGGIGGVTTRGAAYYLERYWRGLIDTPGVVGSAEFTLNWVLAPFEDLTNQTREDAWKTRLPHSMFSTLNPADHVPLVMPEQVVPDDCYRSMQAFHGPLYIIAQRPGGVVVLHGGADTAAAEGLAGILRGLGKEAECRMEESGIHGIGDRHVVAFLREGSRLRRELEAGGVIEPVAVGMDSPLIQTRVNPQAPERLLVTLTATGGEAASAGGERLLRSAEELLRLRRLEGAMGRVVALVDKPLTRVYTRYLLEQVGRGYMVAGDDTREFLEEADFYVSGGQRRAAWSDWTALILDCGRELRADELALVRRVCDEGVNVLISRACHLANPGLRVWSGIEVAGEGGSLADTFALAPQLSGPLPVGDLGGADMAVIERFAAGQECSRHLEVSALAAVAEGVETLASGVGGRPVVAARKIGNGTVVVFGCDFGRASEILWGVTHSGKLHRLYDRDTACGLERVGRCLVNACLQGREPERMRPRLYVRVEPDAVLLRGGRSAVARMVVTLCDVEGRPVEGELLAKPRVTVDGRRSSESGFVRMEPTAAGRFRVVCAPEGADSTGSGLVYRAPERLGKRWTLISVQFKAYAEGHVPFDGAAAFIVTD